MHTATQINLRMI